MWVGCMDFRVLGELGVSVGGRVVALGGPRQRALLAALVSRAGETVRISLLCNDIWDVPPAAAEAQTAQQSRWIGSPASAWWIPE
jgi:DNA-binding SARP family transcriptional activator